MAERLPDFDALWNYDDPTETETRFRELLPTAEESGNPGYPMQLLTQIARTHSLRRQFAEAHALLDQIEPHLAVDPTVEVRYLLERGRTYNSSGQPQKARGLFVQAWDKARTAQADFFAVDAAHMVAIVEETPDQQLVWNRKGLELAEQSDQPRVKKWLGSLYNNIGWTYHDQGDYEQALDNFQKALGLARTPGRQ